MAILRNQLWLACGAILLLGACGVWFNRTLNSQWHKGFAAGQAEIARQQNIVIQKQREATQAAKLISERRVVELEQYSESLQKKLAELALVMGAQGRG